jgi:hypothetical protein
MATISSNSQFPALRPHLGRGTSPGRCRICGLSRTGQPFDVWVKPTFTDWDKLQPGEIICDECLAWFDERSEILATRVGKDKPQRMRNYSHFVVEDEWIPLSKGDKARMAEILLRDPFPELAAIAESGQKHIIFRAPRNPPGSKAGWVQLEEKSLYVEPDRLRVLLGLIEALYAGFSKAEIETARYKGYRVVKFGYQQWDELERQVRSHRGSLLFHLALFLVQKGDLDDDDGATSESCRPADDDLARDTGRLQEPLPDDDLAAVRGSRAKRGLHQQPGTIRQLSLFANGSDDRPEG